MSQLALDLIKEAKRTHAKILDLGTLDFLSVSAVRYEFYCSNQSTTSDSSSVRNDFYILL